MTEQPPRISVTFTILIWAGILLMVMGGLAAIVGLGGSTIFDVKYGDNTFKTTSVGLAVMAVGALVAGIVALRLPAGTTVLSGTRAASNRTLTERLAAVPAVYFLVALAAILVAIVAVVL